MMKVKPRVLGLLPLLVALVLSGCASVTINPNDLPKTEAMPTYEDTVDFYIFGLTPKVQEVDPVAVCEGDDIRQMQTQTTLVNGLLTFVTLGIYAPRTVRVWCEEA